MKTKFIEAHNDEKNWGKFMVGRFEEEEFQRSSLINPPRSLLRQRGWTEDNIIVMDLETGEAARFRPGGSAMADLAKHEVWVCPLFEPFLEWLYRQDVTNLDALPAVVNLPDAPFAFVGYRRKGRQ